MDVKLKENYNYILSFVSPRLKYYLENINNNLIEIIQEIRIRANKPVIIVTKYGCSYLTISSKISSILSSNCIFSNINDITDSVNRMCGYSFHSHTDDMINGYITLPNGARVGITGTAVFDNNAIKGIKNIDGINIRIPRNVYGISDLLINKLFSKSIMNTLIVGPPSSGKTTLLKDVAFQLSSGKNGILYKVCIVDERKEISSNNTIELNGPNTDVLLGFPKKIGLSMAIRTLSPDVIICDEISSNELDVILDAINSGISLIFSIHAKNYIELKQKLIYKKLIINNCIDSIVFLKNSSEPGVIDKVICLNEVNNEIDVDNVNSDDKHNFNISLYEA